MSSNAYLLIGGLAVVVIMASGRFKKLVTPSPMKPTDLLKDGLEQIRAKYGLPALGGAIFTGDGLVEEAATGVRKAGTTVAVTAQDKWHLGSDTKMMTALLAGTLVAEGKLSWDAKVATFFPEAAAKWPAALREVTIGQVLAHEAGLKANLTWVDFLSKGTLREQRSLAARMAMETPEHAPGSYHYSNAGYVVAAAVMEGITGEPWETLMRERVFKPLKMDAAGWGGLGTPGEIDQPWPHKTDGRPVAKNGPLMDNAPVMGPAGAVHGTMEDWAKFLADQLRGGTGRPALLPEPIYRAMQTPGHGSTHGYGWAVADRSWAGGKALKHAGSNTMNYAVCWLAPAKDFGVLVCTNQGGDAAAKACDDAASAMIQRYLFKPQTQ